MSSKQDNTLSKTAMSAAYTSSGNKQKVSVPTRSDGSIGVRAALNNMGISNSMIGYDEGSKTVTLGGKTLIRPSYIDEDAGVSYTSPSEIQNSLVSYYSTSSNPIVKVSDAYSNYAGQYGLTADALKYGNGTVTLGGNPLNVLYTDDEGKSWAFESDVKDAVNNYINSFDIESPNELLNSYNDRYLAPAARLSRSISNRGEFSYNPENDPVYRAYKNQYTTQGARASRNAMANYAALTGGYANSAAATAAAQTNQYYMTQLTNQIPALAQAAYQRYADKYATDIKLLDSMLNQYDTAYNNALNANSKTTENINSSATSNTDRDKASSDKYWEDVFNNQKYSKNEADMYWTEKQNEQDYNWTDLLNTQKSSQNQYTIEGLRLNNIQKEIYLKYYDSLMQSELENSNLNNRLIASKLFL